MYLLYVILIKVVHNPTKEGYMGAPKWIQCHTMHSISLKHPILCTLSMHLENKQVVLCIKMFH
jgi:hypothetical protein